MTNLSASRELDALVAEKVFRLEVCRCEQPSSCGFGPQQCAFGCGGWIPLAHSTSIAAAWLVVEKLSDKWEMNLRTILPARDYVCEFKLVVKNKCIVDAQHPFEHVWNNPVDTAPLAICLAALKAVGDKVPAHD